MKIKRKIAFVLSGLLITAGLPISSFALDNQIFTGLSYDGMRVTEDKFGLMGYVDEEGNGIVPCKYTRALDFINGVSIATMMVGEKEEYYAIDTEGKAKKFDPALGTIDYYDGTFGVASIPSNNPISPIKSALLDKDGNRITGYDYDGIYVRYIINSHKTIILAHKGEKVGVIDPNGKEVIPIEYSSIQWFPAYPDVYSVIKQEAPGQFKSGYIRSNGEILFDIKYDSAAEFEEGFGRLEKNGKWAVVDLNGKFVTGFIYDRLDAFHEGIAGVSKDGKYGFIDTRGNVAIPIQYKDTWFSDYGIIHFFTDNGTKEVTLKNPIMEQRDINIYLNGKWVYSDQEPIIQNNRTLAPFRAISEALCYSVEWDGKNRSVILQNFNKIIQLRIDSNQATVNTFDDGKAPETIILDAPVTLINGRAFVPVRFLAENIGAEVNWNPENRDIDIKTE